MSPVLSVLLLTLILLGFSIDQVSAGIPESENPLFSTVWIEEAPGIRTPSDGDLWPSCWAADDVLYTANGDGFGFTRLPGSWDITVCRIVGRPPHWTGETLAVGDAVGSIWTPGDFYNRKPTGMVCVDGDLYLAIQDLATDFNDAPAASISRSTDGGRTWTWDRSGPMFKDHVFTTLFFLDYGQNNQHAPDGYVYAYGLDHNWRDSFNDRVPDPTRLYLARVPGKSVQNRSAWTFFTGQDARGEPVWSEDINQRTPVLETDRRVYPRFHADRGARNMTVLSQGGVVYNKPLDRFIYTSWTEYTFEFFEAPAPWGPWRLFHRKDFGAYPWTETKMGGYGATIPSRFISADGKTMYIQDNTFVGGARNYGFALRKMVVEPYKPSPATNRPDSTNNLARTVKGIVPIAKTFHLGSPQALHDGNLENYEDDWDQEIKENSWWGYTWKGACTVNRVVFTTGPVFPDGGWFQNPPRVQVRRNFQWVDAKNQEMAPAFSRNPQNTPFRTHTIRFEAIAGTGVRILGTPGGDRTFSSIAELEVYFDTDDAP